MNYQRLGENIKTMRNRKGLTQAELGDKIRVDQKTISAYELGQRIMTSGTLIFIAAGLECSLDELTDGVIARSSATMGSD